MKKAKAFIQAITSAGIFQAFAAPVFAADVTLCPEGSQFGPLCTFAQNGDVFGTIVKFVITILLIAAVVISTVFLIYGGIRWIISGGDKAAVEAARNTIIAAIIGLVVSFVAFLIIQLIATSFGLGNLFHLTLPTLSP